MSSLNVNVKQAENVPSLYTKKDNTHLGKNKCNTLSLPEVFDKIRGKILLSYFRVYFRSERQHEQLFQNLWSKSLQNTSEGVYF